MGTFAKSIAPCDGGINHFKRPHVIKAEEWLTLQQLRCKEGIVQNFPGWASVVGGASVGAFGSLGFEFNRANGTSQYLVGGDTKVYQALGGALVDISGAFAFGPTLAFPWSAFPYRDKVYLTDPVDGLYKYDPLVGVLAPVAGAPKGAAVAVLNDHILLLNTTRASDGILDNQLFRWAAEGTETDWTATAALDAGEFKLSNIEGAGLTFIPLGLDMVAYMLNEVVTLTFVGGNEVFGVSNRNQSSGALGPGAVGNCFDYHLVFGTRSIYRNDGGRQFNDEFSHPVRKMVYDNLHATYRNRARVFHWQDTREVLFAYPSLASVGFCDTAVVWDVEEQRWSGPFVLPVSCFVPPALHDVLFVDTIGDVVRLSDATQDAKGVAITRVAETGDQFIGTGAVHVERGTPLEFPLGTIFDTDVVNVQCEPTIATALFQISGRRNLNDPVVYQAAVPVDLSSGTFTVPARANGRWFRIKLTLNDSKQLRLAGYQYEFQPAGRR